MLAHVVLSTAGAVAGRVSMLSRAALVSVICTSSGLGFGGSEFSS
jgi:hypothetical protein